MPQTRDQIQLSYGRLEDWLNVNPLLLSGEIACVFDNDNFIPIDLRIGNGVLRFADLPSFLTKDFTYSKEEINELLVAIGERISHSEEQIEGIKTETIPALQDAIDALNLLVDANASAENKLTALSTVTNIVTQALETRLGRLVTATISGLPFGDIATLQAGPWYFNSVRLTKDGLLLGDQAYITGLAYPYYFDGSSWQPQSVVFTAEQNAVLSSGVTSDTVRTLNQTVVDVNNLRTSLTAKADKYAVYKHEVKSVRYNNTVYYKNTLAYLFDGGNEVGRAIITEDCSLSNPLSRNKLYIFDTVSSLPTTELTLKAESDSSDALYSFITVDNTLVSRNLADTATYLENETGKLANTRLDRGLADAKYRLVKNRRLEEIYTAETIRYVDGNYAGTEQGIEIAPFRTIAAALSSRSKDVAIVVAPYSGGYSNTNGRLSLLGRTNTDIVGYAVGSQSPTKLNVPVVVGADSANATRGVGLRDLDIPSLTLQSGSDYFFENVTIQDSSVGSSIVVINLSSVSARVVFSHCTFRGKLLVSGGDVQFDSCDFAIGSLLDVSDSAKVVVRDCAGLSVNVRGTAIYIQESAILVPNSSSFYSFSATATSSAQPFVGLFSGASLDSLGTSSAVPNYAPISIASGVTYALGSFIYKKEGSLINGTRLVGDGLDSAQVYAGSKTLANDGYAATGYLDSHLSAIGQRLKEIASGTEVLASAVTSVAGVTDMTSTDAQGLQNGQVRILVTKGSSSAATKVNAQVKGLGSAAYASTSDFASVAEFNTLRETVSTIGTTVGNHTQSITTLQSGKQDVSNMVPSVSAASDNTHYPTAKAVWDQIATLTDQIGQLSSSSILLPSDSGDTIFASLTVLNTAGTAFYDAQGNSATPQPGDRAFYFGDAAGEDKPTLAALYSEVGGSTQWRYFYNVSMSLTPSEQAALESGITSDWMTTASSDIAGKQGKVSLSANTSDSYLLTSSSNTGNLATTVGARTISTSIPTTGSIDDIPTIAAVRTYITSLLADTLTNNNITTSVAEGSTLLPTGGAVYTALSAKQNTIDATHKLSPAYISESASYRFVTDAEKSRWDSKSIVSVSNTGIATEEVQYITIDGVERKIGSTGGSYFPFDTTDYEGGASYLIGSSTTDFNDLKYRGIAVDSPSDDSFVPTIDKVEHDFIKKNAFSTPSSEQALAAGDFVPVYNSDNLSFIKKKYTANISQDVKKVEGNSDSSLSLQSYTYYFYHSSDNSSRNSYIKLKGTSYQNSSSYTSLFLGLDKHGEAIESNPFSGVTVYFSLPDSGMDLALDNSLVAFKWTGSGNATKLSLTNSTAFMWFPESTQEVTQTYALFNSQFYLHFDASNTTTGASPCIPEIEGSNSVIYLSGHIQAVDFTDLVNSIVYVGDGCTVDTSKISSSNKVIYLSTSTTASNIRTNAFLTTAENSSVETSVTNIDGSTSVGGSFVANLSVPYAKVAKYLATKPTISGGVAEADAKYGDQIYITAGGQDSRDNGAGTLLPYAVTATKLVSGQTQTYGDNANKGISIGSPVAPVYFNNGLPVQCSTYAGGTLVTLNGTLHDSTTASFYAPTSSGSYGATLSANANGVPTWFDGPDACFVVKDEIITEGSYNTSYRDSSLIIDITQPGSSTAGYHQVVLRGNLYNCSIIVRANQNGERNWQGLVLCGRVVGCKIEYQTSKALLVIGTSSGSNTDRYAITTGCTIMKGNAYNRKADGSYENTNTPAEMGYEHIYSYGMFVSNRVWESTTDTTRPNIYEKGMTFGNWNGSVIF